MKLNPLTDEHISLLPDEINLRDLIYIQKATTHGTKALNSVLLKDINPHSKTLTVTVERQDGDFDRYTTQATARRSFVGRINDNLQQLLPEFTISVTWLSAFDEPYEYKLTPNQRYIKRKEGTQCKT